MIDFSRLRQWQSEALEKYRVMNLRDFSVTATPGAGKTTYALALATALKNADQFDQLIIVAPTDHLRTQWAEAAGDVGIFLDPSLNSRAIEVTSDYVGYVTTYAQVAINWQVHARRVNAKRTFVVFDEIHHAGDGLSWGDAVRQAFNGAHRRICLTGTPFRTSATSTIPFMHYETQPDGTLMSTTDYAYGYGEALRDHVVRPVTFAAYSGESTWTDAQGGVMSADLTDDANSKEIERLALKATLDPEGSWIPHVFEAAHEQLMMTRNRGGMSDAGGLILASDQTSATAYARIMEQICGQPVALIISEDSKASAKIDQFKNDPSALWMVAVRMVSEGVDVPRLAVGVWATNYRTPLFFAQAVGRFVRARAPHEHATVFLPATRPLLMLAAEMEEKRNHVIVTQQDEFDELADPLENAPEVNEERVINSMTTLKSHASFDHVLFNGHAVDGLAHTLTPEEEAFIGIPGILGPQEMANLLRQRDAEIRSKRSVDNIEVSKPQVHMHVAIAETRRDINKLVSRIALKRNVEHSHVHKMSQSAIPGPASSSAPLEILEKRKEWLQKIALR